MCGIVGYIGNKDVVPLLLDGLQSLEYRGYDSAGVAVLTNGHITVRKAAGKLVSLRDSLETEPLKGTLGVGHTRWATHGPPSQINSHPHSDQTGTLHLVHNGIIENYQSLKEQMIEEGHVFESQTDTEALAHLVGKYFEGDLASAVRTALKEVEGAYALGIVSSNDPQKLVAARCGSPLIVGLGEEENFIASDVPAILKYTREIIYLDDFEVITLERGKVTITDLDGNEKHKSVNHIDWDASAAEKGGFPHFMLKEIHEQPKAIRDTLRGRFDGTKINLDTLNLSDNELKLVKNITITACGTAFHAGLVGKYLLEEFVRIPVVVDLASEFRYRNPIIDHHSLAMTITQSGETADTLAGLREAKAHGAKVISVCNVVGSSIARESDGLIYQQAGPEIGVASTKAYTSQVSCLTLFTIYLAMLRGRIDLSKATEMIEALKMVPDKLEAVIANQDSIREIAIKHHKAKSALFMGRGYNYPTAMEGALKLKEISYIHAEGYPAGEMKHGPIALIEPDLPVVCVCVQSRVYEKMISNIQEIRARGGKVIAIATEGDTHIKDHADDLIFVPETAEFLSPIIAAVPMQLLAYHMAIARGCDVDQPRNLAKSVTVE